MRIFNAIGNLFAGSKEKKESKDSYFSIEQAGNWIREKFAKGMRNVAKEQTKDFHPTVALEQDRDRYLRYSVGLLNVASPRIMRMLPRNIIAVNGLSQTGVAKLLKIFLILRLNGMSDNSLSDYFKVPMHTIKELEKIAVEAVKDAITENKVTGIPIIGG